MSVPAFSHFSAISELFVTAAVFHVLWHAWKHDELRLRLLGGVLAFEALVNITYMSLRIAMPSGGLKTTGWMGWLLAGHGTLSLLMFVGLIAFALEARRLKRDGRNLVRERPGTTLGFVALWTLSIASGEAIYIVQLMR